MNTSNISPIQLNFWGSQKDVLIKALQTFQRFGLEHYEYRRFVRSLAISVKTCLPGASIVACCSSGRTVDEAISGMLREIRHFNAENFQQPCSGQPIRIRVPIANSYPKLEAELFDRYFRSLETIPFGHRGNTFRLSAESHGENFPTRTRRSQLATLLETKNPPFAIIENTENLGWPTATLKQQRAAWNLIIDIARQSGVPHLLIGPITKTCETLDLSELGEPMQLEVMRPYEWKNSNDRAHTTGILEQLNKNIPWADPNESLSNYSEEIDKCIFGDISRLRDWIIRSIRKAISDENTNGVSWDHLAETSPGKSMANAAKSDKTNALAIHNISYTKSNSVNDAGSDISNNEGKDSDLQPGVRKNSNDMICPL